MQVQYDLACRGHDTVDLAFQQSRDGACPVFTGSGCEMGAGEGSPELVRSAALPLNRSPLRFMVLARGSLRLDERQESFVNTVLCSAGRTKGVSYRRGKSPSISPSIRHALTACTNHKSKSQYSTVARAHASTLHPTPRQRSRRPAAAGLPG